jgi:hypothetical protein
MVRVTDDEVKEWAGQLKSTPTVVPVGASKLIPLQLEKGSAVGAIDSKYYDPAPGKGWTATIAITRFK